MMTTIYNIAYLGQFVSLIFHAEENYFILFRGNYFNKSWVWFKKSGRIKNDIYESKLNINYEVI